MVTRILAAVIVLVAVIEGLAPGVVPEAILPLALVILGLAWGVLGVDDDNRVQYLVIAVAVGGAAAGDVLNHIHVIGAYLDAILDQISVALWAGVVSVLVLRIWERIMPAEGEE